MFYQWSASYARRANGSSSHMDRGKKSHSQTVNMKKVDNFSRLLNYSMMNPSFLIFKVKTWWKSKSGITDHATIITSRFCKQVIGGQAENLKRRVNPKNTRHSVANTSKKKIISEGSVMRMTKLLHLLSQMSEEAGVPPLLINYHKIKPFQIGHC
ncbi:uncharacterized protein LOC119731124 [Patiria miniata]|uniref:Uncharacterized protein n=1 Tax=Patiria miniata TaxID=46514 RepID=A0A914A8I1_PATMI|nr:uncharacterized protein LOC119731124 [Patiria miniata]